MEIYPVSRTHPDPEARDVTSQYADSTNFTKQLTQRVEKMSALRQKSFRLAEGSSSLFEGGGLLRAMGILHANLGILLTGSTPKVSAESIATIISAYDTVFFQLNSEINTKLEESQRLLDALEE